MKRIIIALIVICVFLTSCAKNNTDIPIEETTAGTKITTSEMPPSTMGNSANNEMKNAGNWEDGIAKTSRFWIDAYSAILNGDNELGIDFYNYDLGIDGPENQRYDGCGLYDLDKDGTPELYVAIGEWEGGFYHIFTCIDGEGRYVGQVYGRYVEKSTGILFNTSGESGYTPDIAYQYTQGSITEIPNYVQSLYETDELTGVSEPKVKLGGNSYNYSSPDLYFVPIYDNLEWAVTNQEIDNR